MRELKFGARALVLLFVFIHITGIASNDLSDIEVLGYIVLFSILGAWGFSQPAPAPQDND